MGDRGYLQDRSVSYAVIYFCPFPPLSPVSCSVWTERPADQSVTSPSSSLRSSGCSSWSQSTPSRSRSWRRLRPCATRESHQSCPQSHQYEPPPLLSLRSSSHLPPPPSPCPSPPCTTSLRTNSPWTAKTSPRLTITSPSPHLHLHLLLLLLLKEPAETPSASPAAPSPNPTWSSWAPLQSKTTAPPNLPRPQPAPSPLQRCLRGWTWTLWSCGTSSRPGWETCCWGSCTKWEWMSTTPRLERWWEFTWSYRISAGLKVLNNIEFILFKKVLIKKFKRS